MRFLLATLLSCICSAGTTGLASEVCIDIGGDSEMTCTKDVLEMRARHDEVSINVGVTQRIDGSDSEKQAVRDVLKHMDNYFFHEVLALPEYEFARFRCKNSNELCAFWSSVGECESNRIFMLTNCPAACRFCLLLHSGLAS
jgi:hypothetical protein